MYKDSFIKKLVLLLSLFASTLYADSYVYSVKDPKTGKYVKITKAQYDRMKREQAYKIQQRNKQIQYENYINELAKKQKNQLYLDSIKYLEEKKKKEPFVTEQEGEKEITKHFVGIYKDDTNKLVNTLYLKEIKEKNNGVLGFIQGDKKSFHLIYEIVNIKLIDKRKQDIRDKFRKEIVTVDLVEFKLNIFNEYKVFDHFEYKNNEFEITDEFIRDIDHVNTLELRSSFLFDRQGVKTFRSKIEPEDIQKIKNIISK